MIVEPLTGGHRRVRRRTPRTPSGEATCVDRECRLAAASYLFGVESIADVDRVARLNDLRDGTALVDREHRELADHERREVVPIHAVDGEEVSRRDLGQVAA